MLLDVLETELLSLRRGIETGDNVVLDTALILTAEDAEETVLSPIVIPAVGDQPVGKVGSLIDTPTDDLDSMTTELSASGVLVDTASVSLEVGIHSESSLNRTIGHDLLLDLGDIRADGVRGGEDMLILSVGSGVGRVGVACSGASGCGELTTTRNQVLAVRITGVRVVVLAILEGVRAAPRVVTIVTTGDNTSLCEPRPGRGRITAIAAETARGTAREQVGDGQVHVLTGLNADTVRTSLSGTEGPARTAIGLVTNLLNGRAVGPLSARVEGDRDVSNVEASVSEQGELLRRGDVEVTSTELTLHGIDGAALEAAVEAGGPSGVGVRVDALDNLEAGLVVLVEVRATSLSEANEGKDAQNNERCNQTHFIWTV